MFYSCTCTGQWRGLLKVVCCCWSENDEGTKNCPNKTRSSEMNEAPKRFCDGMGGIPDICHFFILTHFQAWKFYTQKCVNSRQKLHIVCNITLCVLNIPHICHFFYTHTFWGLEILHSKVRKFATKIYPRQNSVDYTLCLKLHTVCNSTHSVQFTLFSRE